MSKGFILKTLFRGIIPDVPIIKKKKTKNKYTYKTCNGNFLRYFRDERCKPAIIHFRQCKLKTVRM